MATKRFPLEQLQKLLQDFKSHPQPASGLKRKPTAGKQAPGGQASQPVTHHTPAQDPPTSAWTPGVENPENPLNWGPYFPKAAKTTLANTQMRANLGKATNTIRTKRGMRVAETPDWEELREAATEIKAYTLSHLPELLVQLEENVTKRGGIVHWARDAKEANQIVHSLIAAKGVDEVVKIKSMATQEIGLNEYLLDRGIMAWETDLAEMIVQLSEDMPSHVVVPAIHRNRAEVRAIFHERMGHWPANVSDKGLPAPEGLSAEPRELTMAARAHLRDKFLHAKVAVSGSNMMIAETGTLSIFESEGNGRMCLTLPDTLISIVGIEKLVPTFRDSEVFAQLLPRSATGERMNPYTSMWTGVTESDGPQEFHLVLLDNGRTKVLADQVGSDALKCIRCGACLNACPVYQHVGGHAYGSVYPGPIGSVLTPQLNHTRSRNHPSSALPFACSLCNACAEACPAKIPLPEILVELRKQINDRKHFPPNVWDVAMKGASYVMRSGDNMAKAEAALPLVDMLMGKKKAIKHLPGPGAKWGQTRDVPAPPKQSFRQWWAKREATKGAAGSNQAGAAVSCPTGAQTASSLETKEA